MATQNRNAQRILVVDDDPAITSVLRRGLIYEGFIVDVASSGEQGLQLAREHSPDLVILDILMPGLDGLEVLGRLRAADGQLPILMLTAKDAAEDELRGFQSGADDYVVKPFTFEILLARVKALLRRRDMEEPDVLSFSNLALDTGTRQARRGDRIFELTPTEYDLLSLFLQHPRQVLTREIIMDRVWDYDFGGNENVLETYIKQLRQKLEAADEERLIHTVRGVGYVLREL